MSLAQMAFNRPQNLLTWCKTATGITLFVSDTVQDVLDKFNEAIGSSLGQTGLDDVGVVNADKFASYVTTAMMPQI